MDVQKFNSVRFGAVVSGGFTVNRAGEITDLTHEAVEQVWLNRDTLGRLGFRLEFGFSDNGSDAPDSVIVKDDMFDTPYLAIHNITELLDTLISEVKTLTIADIEARYPLLDESEVIAYQAGASEALRRAMLAVQIFSFALDSIVNHYKNNV